MTAVDLDPSVLHRNGVPAAELRGVAADADRAILFQKGLKDLQSKSGVPLECSNCARTGFDY